MFLFLISSMVLNFLDQLQILRVVSDRIIRTFNRSAGTLAATPDISTTFDRV